jgi:hypothetical protein
MVGLGTASNRIRAKHKGPSEVLEPGKMGAAYKVFKYLAVQNTRLS